MVLGPNIFSQGGSDRQCPLPLFSAKELNGPWIGQTWEFRSKIDR